MSDSHHQCVKKDDIILSISGGHNMSHEVSVYGTKDAKYKFDYNGIEHTEKEYILTVIVKYSGNPTDILNSAKQRHTITGEMLNVNVKENNY